MSQVIEPPVRQAAPPSKPATTWISWNFAGTVLVSAFLLFQVQPLISKFILPWFGGSPAVWTTCMLFFQVLLFAGYTYAHLSQKLLRPKSQGICHGVLLLASLLLLHVEPSVSWKPPDSSQPTWRILQLLTACVGLPYFALSATGPLLQAWFSRAYPGRSPYRLYALSNAGSLVALLSYPFVFEPAFDVIEQIRMWSAAFFLFVVLCGACALWIARHHWGPVEIGSAGSNGEMSDPAFDAVPSPWRRLLWLGLPATASLMLLATTNHVCQDVAVIPFLWVVPLSLYLLTFIICFDHQRWYVRPLFCNLAIVLLMSIICLAEIEEFMSARWNIVEINYKIVLVLLFTTMFCVCMLCHGELVRSRPSPRYLTEFYLLISAGGAMGGIFVSLIAPAIFSTHYEWKIAIMLSYALAVAVAALGLFQRFAIYRSLIFCAAVPLGLAGPSLLTWLESGYNQPLVRARNFYGVVSVWEEEKSNPRKHHFSMMNGGTVHGRQYTDPSKSRLAISYYPLHSGVGEAVTWFQDRPNIKVGTIGLGAGTMAAYARPGDYFRFYEINPVVLDMANRYFTYLSECRGKYDVVLGDARLSLEREEPQAFHVLVVDAFSGDAIPTHLLTREAFETYQRHLAPDGILAIHITNHYLDLEPVVTSLAKHFEFGTTRIDVPEEEPELVYDSNWVLVTRNQTFLDSHPRQTSDGVKPPREVRLWTDHFSNLFEILY